MGRFLCGSRVPRKTMFSAEHMTTHAAALQFCLPHVDPARNFTLSPPGPAGFLRQHAIPFLSVSLHPFLSSCLPGSAGGGTDRLQRRGTAAANLRLRCGPPPAVGGAAAAAVVHRADDAPRQLLPRARRLVQRHCVVRPAQQQQQFRGHCYNHDILGRQLGRRRSAWLQVRLPRELWWQKCNM